MVKAFDEKKGTQAGSETDKHKPVFVYDPEMTPAERRQARKEQLQNLREQEALKQLLADEDKTYAKMAEKHQQREKEKVSPKTKEAKLDELYQKENQLLAEEHQAAVKLKKLTDDYEKTETNLTQLRLIMEGLNQNYPSDYQFVSAQEEFSQAAEKLRNSFTASITTCRKKRDNAAEEQHQIYQERIHLANSSKDDKEESKQ